MPELQQIFEHPPVVENPLEDEDIEAEVKLRDGTVARRSLTVRQICEFGEKADGTWMTKIKVDSKTKREIGSSHVWVEQISLSAKRNTHLMCMQGIERIIQQPELKERLAIKASGAVKKS
jgi:hypothetical protein